MRDKHIREYALFLLQDTWRFKYFLSSIGDFYCGSFSARWRLAASLSGEPTLPPFGETATRHKDDVDVNANNPSLTGESFQMSFFLPFFFKHYYWYVDYFSGVAKRRPRHLFVMSTWFELTEMFLFVCLFSTQCLPPRSQAGGADLMRIWTLSFTLSPAISQCLSSLKAVLFFLSP